MHPTSYGTPTVHGMDSNVYIGKYCSIADSVQFDAGIQHNTRFVTTYPLWKIGVPENKVGMSKGDIHIGNDVWIGDGVMIMSNVTIGDGSVIGARSVVTHDVEPYHIVGGSPARYLKNRFPDPGWKNGNGYRPDKPSRIERRLLKIKWWDWPEEKIRAFGPLMLSENIELFLERAEA